MTSVRRGFAMGGSACNRTLARARYRTPSASNVKEESGSTEAGYSSAHSAMAFFAKTINLNIRRHAKFWNQKISNVNHAIVSDNIRAYVARLATVKITFGGKASSTKRTRQYLVQNAIMKHP